jgi:hypothetical protein
MIYNVTLEQSVIEHTVVQVEATNEHEAREKAIRHIMQTHHDAVSWKFHDVWTSDNAIEAIAVQEVNE